MGSHQVMFALDGIHGGDPITSAEATYTINVENVDDIGTR